MPWPSGDERVSWVMVANDGGLWIGYPAAVMLFDPDVRCGLPVGTVFTRNAATAGDRVLCTA
jgi:hypothetical protein